MFGGQFGIQRFLLIVALICVPWMLCAKPFILYRANKQKQLVRMTTSSFSIYVWQLYIEGLEIWQQRYSDNDSHDHLLQIPETETSDFVM